MPPTPLKAGRETAEFTFEVQHIGLDMTFHHPKGRDLGLDAAVIETFESEREHAEIFIQNATGTAFSTEELLSWFLLQTGTTLADQLPKSALDKGEGHVFVTFPIRFEQGVFHMITEEGAQDLSALKVMSKVTIHKRPSQPPR
ncbi:hypothetical protein [Magnetovibrio sp.]|uniref:hypothetical protein n=1 Tax=Magnetovibrio sp. TaxID=2024836 RepID=UPI002F959B7A